MTLPTTITDLPLRPISAIRPFDDLPIDAAIWDEAHAYHTKHRRLHLLSSHRPGIVGGLEVVLSATAQNRVTISPGIGVDRQGNLLVLHEPISLLLEEQGLLYLLLAFQSVADRNSAVVTGGGEQYYRVIEGKDVRATRELPKTPYLELARIYRTKGDDIARIASNPFDPGSNELNLLHRSMSFPACFADGSIGELAYVPQRDKQAGKPNRTGLVLLSRMAALSGIHADFLGAVNVQRMERRDLLLLYLAGNQPFAPLSDDAVVELRKLLEEGAVLLGESCGGDEWKEGFLDLTRRLGANLQPMDHHIPLLTAHHVFGEPPPGAAPSGKLQGDSDLGVLFSDCNWGGVWQGQADQGIPTREQIRSAQEWGINLLAWAAERRRTVALSRM